MLDVRRIRQNPQELRDMLQNRNKDAAIVDDFLARDEQRRKLMAEVEEKKALRNQTSKQIGLAKKNGASEAETAAIVSRRNRHRHGRHAIGKRHSITPLKNFYSSNRGHDVDLC